MPNRNTLISNKINTFEPTLLQIDGRNQLIKNIEIIDRGSGYTGEESVIVDGEKLRTGIIILGGKTGQKINYQDLLDLNEDGGLLKLNTRNSLITGIDWSNLELSTFSSVPSISIKNKDGSIDTKGGILKCISGQPTPNIKIDVSINNLNDLELGNTIGKKFDDGRISQNTYLKCTSNLKYEVSLIQNKELNVRTTEDKNKIEAEHASSYFSEDSLSNFQFNLKNVIDNLFRCEFGDECYACKW